MSGFTPLTRAQRRDALRSATPAHRAVTCQVMGLHEYSDIPLPPMPRQGEIWTLRDATSAGEAARSALDEGIRCGTPIRLVRPVTVDEVGAYYVVAQWVQP